MGQGSDNKQAAEEIQEPLWLDIVSEASWLLHDDPRNRIKPVSSDHESWLGLQKLLQGYV